MNGWRIEARGGWLWPSDFGEDSLNQRRLILVKLLLDLDAEVSRSWEEWDLNWSKEEIIGVDFEWLDFLESKGGMYEEEKVWLVRLLLPMLPLLLLLLLR